MSAAIREIPHLAGETLGNPCGVTLNFFTKRQRGSNTGKLKAALAHQVLNGLRPHNTIVVEGVGAGRISGSGFGRHGANLLKKLFWFQRGRAAALATRRPRSNIR